MLYTARKIIFETIKKDKNPKALYENFSNQILSSDVLKLEYEVLSDVLKAEGKLTLKEANRFVKHLKEKYSKRIENIKYEIGSKRKLLENFGIKEIEETPFDNLISYDTKSLRESAIVMLVHKKEDTISQSLQESKQFFKGVYNSIKRNNDRGALKRQLGLIEAYASVLDANRKKLVHESIKSILDTSTKNFGKSVEKAYKLKLFTEGLFKRANNKLFEADNIDYEALEKELDKQFKGKTISVGNVGKFEKVTIESTMKQDGVVVINFNLKVYPTDSSRIVRHNELLELRNKLIKTKRVLVNNLIYQAGYDYFILDGSRFDVSLNPVVEDKDIPKTGGAKIAKFELILFIKEVMSLEEMKHDFTKILESYYSYLETYIPDNLNNELLLNDIEASKNIKKKNRKRSEVERASDSIIDNEADIDFAFGGSNYFDRFR